MPIFVVGYKMLKMTSNRQIHLISRPQGAPSIEHFQLHAGGIPVLKEGEVLVRPLYLSVDPNMRGRMGGRPSIHPPFPLHQAASGDGVGCVVESKHAHFSNGDLVYGFLEWAEACAIAGLNLHKVEGIPPEVYLSLFGPTAMCAYFGLLDIAKPTWGETVVISGAAGAVGMIAGQIAKIQGCRVIGITGSDAKVDYLINQLEFDAAVNYNHPDWASSMEKIDVYFDNVGGMIADECLKRLNHKARVVLCGHISSYNLEQPDIGPRMFRNLIVKSAMAKGFRVLVDYPHRFEEARQQLKIWYKEGKIQTCETIVHGLENAPQALINLFDGKNLGKQLVRI